MRTKVNRIAQTVVFGAAVFLALSCNSVNRESSPVKLIVTNDQALHQIDLSPTASNCNQNIATINLQSLLLQDQANATLPTDNRFNDIKIDRYEVTYVRTDGGKALPQSFVRVISGLIIAGGSTSLLTTFQAFQPDAVTQAPFASLLPVNGGRDPETGKDFVQMDIILTVFGQTLAGERVSGTTRIPLTFCFATCNGCS